jgi:hypothetical protein
MSGVVVRRGYRPADRQAWQEAREARRQLLAKVRARRRRLVIERERRATNR